MESIFTNGNGHAETETDATDTTETAKKTGKRRGRAPLAEGWALLKVPPAGVQAIDQLAQDLSNKYGFIVTREQAFTRMCQMMATLSAEQTASEQ